MPCTTLLHVNCSWDGKHPAATQCNPQTVPLGYCYGSPAREEVVPCTQQELETERTESSNNSSQGREKDGRMFLPRLRTLAHALKVQKFMWNRPAPQRRCDSTARTFMNLFMRYSRVHFRHYRKSATVSRHSLFEAIFQWDCVDLP